LSDCTGGIGNFGAEKRGRASFNRFTNRSTGAGVGIEGVFTLRRLTSHWKRLSIGAEAGEKGAIKALVEPFWLSFIPPSARRRMNRLRQQKKSIGGRHLKSGDHASEGRVSKAAVLLMSQNSHPGWQ
jgi:hypothetical protein